MLTARHRPGPLRVHAWLCRRALMKAGLTRQTAAGTCVFTGGAGPTLILLHGLGDNAGTWSQIAPTLLHNHRLLIPDLAGHGDSAPANGRLSLNTLLTALRPLLARESQAILIGNSLGAWLAFLLALELPTQVPHLIAINGGPLTATPTGLTLMPATLPEARRLFAAIRDPESPKLPDPVLYDAIHQARTGPIARFAAAAASLSRHHLDQRLHEITATVDLLWGESDRLVPLSYARRLLAGLPGASLTTLPRCGHIPQQERPAETAAALLEILERRTQP